jgi:hypothetical protein
MAAIEYRECTSSSTYAPWYACKYRVFFVETGIRLDGYGLCNDASND